MIVAAEPQELRRVDIIVDHEWVRTVGDVIESSSQRPIIAKRVEALFQVQVECEISRKSIRPGRPKKQLLIIEDIEWESRPQLRGVSKIDSVNDRKPEERNEAPGKKSIRRVPGKRSRCLRADESRSSRNDPAQDRCIDVREIHD